MRQSNASKNRRKKRRRRRGSMLEDSNEVPEEADEITLEEFAEILNDKDDGDKPKKKKKRRKKKQRASTLSEDMFEESTNTVTNSISTTQSSFSSEKTEEEEISTTQSSSSSEKTEEEEIVLRLNSKKKSKKKAKKRAKHSDLFIKVEEKQKKHDGGDDHINKFFDTLENDKKEGVEPKCCGCFNICTASIVMGIFHVLPLIPFCFYFEILETVPYYAAVGIIGLFVIGSLIIAGCCFYNTIRPTAWCCELVGKVQLAVFAILVFILVTCMILAVIQCTEYSKKIDNYICDQLTENLNDSEIPIGIKEFCKDEKFVFWASSIIAVTSFILSIIFIYVGGKFRQMAQYVFHEDVFEEYKALNLLNF